MTQLKILCVTWQSKIRAIPCARNVGDSWGPSDDMLADIAVAEVTGSWDDQEELTDSDVSDMIDESLDDVFDGDDGDDSDGSEDWAGVASLDFLSIQSPKRVRV